MPGGAVMDVDGVRAALSSACVLVGTAVGFYAGFMTRDSMERPEDVTPAPEVRQADGSLILERAPETSPAAQELPPAPVPAGATVERRVRVVAQPVAKLSGAELRITKSAEAVAHDGPCDCPPVTVDLALIREGEGRRVLVWSPDGRILGGLDVPVVAGLVPASQPWAVGVSYGPFDGTPGAWFERDLGRVRVGVDVYQARNALSSGLAVRLRAGWRFGF